MHCFENILWLVTGFIMACQIITTLFLLFCLFFIIVYFVEHSNWNRPHKRVDWQNDRDTRSAQNYTSSRRLPRAIKSNIFKAKKIAEIRNIVCVWYKAKAEAMTLPSSMLIQVSHVLYFIIACYLDKPTRYISAWKVLWLIIVVRNLEDTFVHIK